jgi:hypothetical protein
MQAHMAITNILLTRGATKPASHTARRSGRDAIALRTPTTPGNALRGITAEPQYVSAASPWPGAGYRLGSDRGSPNHGSTLLSKRVMAQIRSPARVST